MQKEKFNLYTISTELVYNTLLSKLSKTGYKGDYEQSFSEVKNKYTHPVIISKDKNTFEIIELDSIDKEKYEFNYLNENLEIEIPIGDFGLKAKSYYNSKDTRKICHDVKKNDNSDEYKFAIETIAKYHASQLKNKEKCVLIPAPNHSGKAEYTYQIARHIMLNSPVPTRFMIKDILGCKPHDTLYDLKKYGKEPDFSFFLNDESFDYKILKEAGWGFYFVDNNIATGYTFNKAAELIPEIIPLPYAIGDFAKVGYLNGKYFVDNLLENKFNESGQMLAEMEKEFPNTFKKLENLKDYTESLTEAKKLISDFCFNEYMSTPTFDNLKEVGLAYTTFEDPYTHEEYEVHTIADLVNSQIIIKANDKIVDISEYDNLKDMVVDSLSNLDFDSLIYVQFLKIDELLKEEREGYEKYLLEIADQVISETFDEPSLAKRAKLYVPSDYGYEEGNKIHILVEFDNEAEREDDLFNALAERHLILANGKEVDFNPIKPEKSGTIEQYLESLERNKENYISQGVADMDRIFDGCINLEKKIEESFKNSLKNELLKKEKNKDILSLCGSIVSKMHKSEKEVFNNVMNKKIAELRDRGNNEEKSLIILNEWKKEIFQQEKKIEKDVRSR